MSFLVDLHCHLDLYPKLEDIISECETERIYTLAVTTTPLAWPRNISLTKNTKHIRTALGLHPQLAQGRLHELSIWDTYFDEAKYIGEIGLDKTPAHYKSFQEQEKIFNHIIRRCSEVGQKILTIHSTKAVSEVLDSIESYSAHLNNKIVLHWFSGSISQAKRAISLNCYFSINSYMLTNRMDLINFLPVDRVLTETDGPFNKLNDMIQKPRDVQFCVKHLSTVWNCSYNEAKDIIFINFKSLI